MKDIYSLSYELKELLANDERVILLDKLEKEMNDNEEVMALAYKKDVAATKYSDVLSHFSDDSEEAKKALKELSIAKEALNNHPLVKQYLKAYADVRDLYLQINEVLFSNFAPNLCPKENK